MSHTEDRWAVLVEEPNKEPFLLRQNENILTHMTDYRVKLAAERIVKFARPVRVRITVIEESEAQK